jgi:hypothetical protein
MRVVHAMFRSILRIFSISVGGVTHRAHSRFVSDICEFIVTLGIEHKSVFIGEVKLYDFKSTLANAGYRSEFYGGVLVVNTPEGPISLKKVLFTY